MPLGKIPRQFGTNMSPPNGRYHSDYDLEAALPYLINRAGIRGAEVFSGELQRFELALPAWRVVASLAHRDGQTLGELAGHTCLELSTLSRLVTSMQRAALLQRFKNGDDKRSVRIFLSPSGEALFDQIVPVAKRYERIALAGISTDEAALLKQLLSRVHENLGTLRAKPRQAASVNSDAPDARRRRPARRAAIGGS